MARETSLGRFAEPSPVHPPPTMGGSTEVELAITVPNTRCQCLFIIAGQALEMRATTTSDGEQFGKAGVTKGRRVPMPVQAR